MFAALLDTNALWPSLQRNFLLSLAVEGLYRPLWSDHILAELRHCEIEKRAKNGAAIQDASQRAAILEAEMRRAFDDALVEGYEPLIGTFELPDPNDEHVMAAAVMGQAGAIVTSNTKHFPTEKMPRGLHVVTPSEFVSHTVEVDPFRAAAAVEAIAARSGVLGPRETPLQVLDQLADRYAMDDVRGLLGDLLTGRTPQ